MNSFRRVSEIFIVAVFVFASMLTAHGQVTTGGVRGSVFDPQNELAALTTGKNLIDQRDVGSADVRITGW